ncbi:response regulator [Halovenus sp. WSH3]|uniref:Response regulator n=1 Tax=Halovenus carboxidivorans TaxID=2692199 RepID=A0A6B0T9B7_9EURY|nr:response regulator [Halovenus carboxidivorans]
MPSGSDTATVLVIDDEEEVADVYALRLRNEYDTRVAYGGEDALETIDIDVDIVLLDRRMPDISGDEVLEQIREKGYDCRVIMLTAVDPGLDIVEMPFDDYLCKPVEKEDLVAAIEQQLQIQRYDEQLSEYFEVTSKLALLESELPPQEREQSDELERLNERAETLRENLDELLDEFDSLDEAFQSIGRHPGQ